MRSLKTIRNDLKSLRSYQVVLFGSQTMGQATKRSDIDIAIVTGIKQRDKNKELWYTSLGKAPSGYDLKVFELLPLPMQMQIISSYKTIFGSPLDISEYFYHYRKLWKDVERRYKENQFSSVKERMKVLRKLPA